MWLTNASLFSDPEIDVILLGVDEPSSSRLEVDGEAFCGDLLTDFFIQCLIAEGSCNQKSASAKSPNIAAAKANLAVEPLLAMVAYSLALSSSSIQP